MDVWLKAAVLGVVEGLTEFLPVSSTGHLLIASGLMRFEGSLGGTFEIFIQFGAVLALLAFYRRDLLAQARAVPRDPAVRRFWLAICVAFLPAAAIGLLLREFIKTVLFDAPALIASMLILGGIAFILLERNRGPAPAPADSADSSLVDISPRQALAIGFAQTLALVPGVSRSGASILGGLAVGLDRPAATRFSFYLAMPTLGAATLVDLAASFDAITGDSLITLLIGTVVSAIVAAASIRWLLGYVAHHTFIPFGIYRIIAGLVILGLVALGVL